MNIYKTDFFARCPVNGLRIKYSFCIHTGQCIPVEEIIKKVDEIKEGLHEGIADTLFNAFGGSQTLVADHHGVIIETIRPFAAHWQSSARDAP